MLPATGALSVTQIAAFQPIEYDQFRRLKMDFDTGAERDGWLNTSLFLAEHVMKLTGAHPSRSYFSSRGTRFKAGSDVVNSFRDIGPPFRDRKRAQLANFAQSCFQNSAWRQQLSFLLKLSNSLLNLSLVKML